MTDHADATCPPAAAGQADAAVPAAAGPDAPAGAGRPAARRAHHLAAAGLGLALGLLALGPALAPGFTLAYDMVFVPRPALGAPAFGLTGMLPRNVPSDVVVGLLAHMLPADAVQKAILLSIFVMACVSAAGLVPSRRLGARLAAGAVYAWNPYVAERLLLGQWALLLGYAALPWVVRAAARGRPRHLALALLPAALGGFAAMAVSAVVVVAVTARCTRRWPDRRGRTWAGTAAVMLALSLPWLVPGLLRASGLAGDPAGVTAFAARADTPFGTVGSLLLLGGAWNAETVPPGYGAPLTVLPWAAAMVAAVAGYARGPYRVPGLGAAAVAGGGVAALGAVWPGASRAAIGMWPGFAVLRDGQQFVAPLAVVAAVGAGALVERLARPEAAVIAAAVPVALLPGLAWGAGGRLTAVHYPRDWARARAVVASAPGDVLVLPWEAYRSYRWNGGRRVLDPLPRYLPVRVILNDGVAVRTRTGGDIRLGPEDPRARSLDRLVRSGAPLTGALRAAGVRYVAVDDPGATRAADGGGKAAGPAPRAEPYGWAARLPGAERVVSGPDLVLYRLPGGVASQGSRVPQLPVYIAWFITVVAFLWSTSLPGSSLIARSPSEES